VVGRQAPLTRAVLFIALLALAPLAARQVELSIDAPPALAGLAARVRNMDTAAFERSLSRAGLDLPRRVKVIIAPASDPLARVAPSWIAGQAFGTDTIIVFPDRISSYPHDSLESVVLHEFVHLSLNARAAGRPLPRWFHEGVAVSVESGWDLASQARLLWAASRRPAIEDVNALFRSSAESETSTAYLLAAALIEDVRARHGANVPGLIAGRVAAGVPFDAAFRGATGETVQEAAAHAWAGYRGWSRWLPLATGSSALWGGILGLALIAFVFRRRRRAQRRRQWDAEEAAELAAAEEADDPTVH
jgi:hypothetical protein